MTGPEHYRRAEWLLEKAAKEELGSEYERWALAAAQVHATLALAAATALHAVESRGCGQIEARQWAGITAPTEQPGGER
ncbi:hypothetical protein DI005_33235 [Prauserella sp. PE36]|uniref:hypothetical protein n=1 Tax=Prauserella sp. PE36 TaxID=1504709 RepID=UPI000DE50512|nr:hypothetical protein [Prauserella sp. PE36]RBM12125.1 hypothetical protein DI005_33235 [Prauserella sp. PE36]